MAIKVIASAIISAAFAILFNVKGSSIIYASLCGAFGYWVYLLIAPMSGIGGLFVSSALMCLYAEALARCLKKPATLFLIAALIPFVPGGGMFQCILFAFNGDLTRASEVGVDTLFQAGAIAGGIIIVSSILRISASGGKSN